MRHIQGYNIRDEICRTKLSQNFVICISEFWPTVFACMCKLGAVLYNSDNSLVMRFAALIKDSAHRFAAHMRL
jgi:hypothetical protein